MSAFLTGINSATQAALSLPRVSALPGIRAWGKRPKASVWMGMISDSTAASPDYWPRRIANRIAAAHPELTVRAYDWSDSLSRMVPTTVQIGSAGERYLSTSVSGVTFLQINSSQIVAGDLVMDVDVEMPDWTPATDQGLLLLTDGTKFVAYFNLLANGKLNIQFFPDNTYGSWTSKSSTVATGFTDGSRHRVRVYLDIDNGAGGYNVQFFESPDGRESWNQIGATVTTAGTTSIGSNWPSQIYIGNLAGMTVGAKYYFATWRRGLNGAPLSPPLDQWARSNNADVVAYGSPEFAIWNAAHGGAEWSYWTSQYLQNSIPVSTSGVIISLGHNYFQGNQSIAGMQIVQDALVTRLRTANPSSQVVVMTQNPKGSANPLDIQQNGLIANQLEASRTSGYDVIDAYTWFIDAGFNDSGLQEGATGTHPTNAWQTKWGDFVYASIFTPAQSY